MSTFEDLELNQELVSACKGIGWSSPTGIQSKALPVAIQGKDVIGLARTGEGKTGAFILPILHQLLLNPSYLFACILAPTRELAFQINDVSSVLGTKIGCKSVVVTGGVDMMSQAIALAKQPHIIVATPGRLLDHLENTKGFNLRRLKVFVLDEADKMLSMDFEREINIILDNIPESKDRQTMLFSATMTKKVSKLERVALKKDAVKVSLYSSTDKEGQEEVFKTANNLTQHYAFIPAKFKEVYLLHLLQTTLNGQGIVFVSTRNSADVLSAMLRKLMRNDDIAIALHGQLTQSKRLETLNAFKAKRKRIVVATDVAARGIDVKDIGFILNFDVPSNCKDYVHRVGRTARNEKSGMAITLVSQYDIEQFQKIEKLIGVKMQEVPSLAALSGVQRKKEIVEPLREKVEWARRESLAAVKDRELNKMRKKRKR